jgi:hypothetical protein
LCRSKERTKLLQDLEEAGFRFCAFHNGGEGALLPIAEFAPKKRTRCRGCRRKQDRHRRTERHSTESFDEWAARREKANEYRRARKESDPEYAAREAIRKRHHKRIARIRTQLTRLKKIQERISGYEEHERVREQFIANRWPLNKPCPGEPELPPDPFEAGSLRAWQVWRQTHADHPARIRTEREAARLFFRRDACVDGPRSPYWQRDQILKELREYTSEEFEKAKRSSGEPEEVPAWIRRIETRLMSALKGRSGDREVSQIVALLVAELELMNDDAWAAVLERELPEVPGYFVDQEEEARYEAECQRLGTYLIQLARYRKSGDPNDLPIKPNE